MAPPLKVVILPRWLVLFFEALAPLAFGGHIRSFPPPFSIVGLHLGNSQVPFSPFDLFTLGSVLTVMVLLLLLFQKTDLGLRMRASAFNPEVSRLLGIRVGRMLTLGWALASLVGALLLGSRIGPSDDYNLTGVAIFRVAAAGLTLLPGLTGQLSLGHGALMAIGASTASLLLKDHRQFPVIVVLLAAVLSTAVIGIGFGYAAARLRGPYLAGATLTLAVALPQVATRYKSIFGGESGPTVAPSSPPDWLGADFPPERWLAWIAFAAAIVTMVLLANLLRGAPGRAFKAVRDNEAAAALAGINVARTQVLAFVVSAACPGLAGGLLRYSARVTGA